MIYILLSIKTRIETSEENIYHEPLARFISYYPLKQGLKHSLRPACQKGWSIYILLSIKTRIETSRASSVHWRSVAFISYYPLKQGLKPRVDISKGRDEGVFISYYPLKQGLKRICRTEAGRAEGHLYPTIH